MTNTIDTSHINYFVTAGTLLAAFKRTDNEEAWCLTTHENDELTDFIRSLHDGELPNDWRYDTIYWIISAIASEDEDTIDWLDVPSEYAEDKGQVTYYFNSLGLRDFKYTTSKVDKTSDPKFVDLNNN